MNNYSQQIKNVKRNLDFIYQLDEQGFLTLLRNKKDNYQMNWLNGKEMWGRIVAPEDISVKIDRAFTEEGYLREMYRFTNETEFDIFVEKNGVGIYTTFPDAYEVTEICMKERCHVHVWCGKETTYLYGLRMSGKPPHLGLILNEGSIDGYSVVRDVEQRSNDRGCLLLHPERFHLRPQESLTIAWDLVWFEKEEGFFQILNTYNNVISVQIDKPVAFEGEHVEIRAKYHKSIEKSAVSIFRNEKVIEASFVNNEILITEICDEIGEIKWDINIHGNRTYAKTLILPKLEKLASNRCKFIIEKQQYQEVGSSLDGAFLVYNNQENTVYYSHLSDHNAGRERVGMGVLIARYLQHHKDAELEKGLDRYTKFIHRELFDNETGVVFNDVKRNNDWHRLYNYPWMAIFFIERFLLYGKEEDLRNMYLIIKTYYKNGGNKFYAIGIPVEESVTLLRESTMEVEAKEIQELYIDHANQILKTSLNYPASEVNYEQGIVAPAVSVLLQVYRLTEKKTYLEEAVKQLEVLELFNGKQPDYHMYETAIRHWDGYWFGKCRIYGDTFPHYWSVLSGNVFLLYWEITKEDKYLAKAQASLRGVLSAFSESGSASCAYIYPQSINGIPGDFADVWANDQDWALYYYLKNQVDSFENWLVTGAKCE